MAGKCTKTYPLNCPIWFDDAQHGDIRITDSIYAPLLGSEVQQRISNLSSGATGPQIAQCEPPPYLQGLSKRELVALLQQAAAQLEE